MFFTPSFSFSGPGQIFFGEGCLDRLASEAARLGTRVFVCTGSNSGRAKGLLANLQNVGLVCQVHAVLGEPDTDSIRPVVETARTFAADLIIGFGGGSVLDTAKAIAALVPNSGDVLDYLETVGAGRSLSNPALPCIAIPTTAGTGAEASRNAVLGVPKRRVKVSLRHSSMMPAIAIVDPTLTWSLPSEPTSFGGMDALTQLIEAFLCSSPTPFTDALARDGIPRASQSLRAAWNSALRIEAVTALPSSTPILSDTEKTARAEMALAALESGLALANARLGAVHGIAGPFGGMVSAPHGAICAALLPQVLASNWKHALAGKTDALQSKTVERFGELAVMLSGDHSAQAEDAIYLVRTLAKELRIPGLGTWGMPEADLQALVSASMVSNSMKGNPFILDEATILGIIQNSW